MLGGYPRVLENALSPSWRSHGWIDRKNNKYC